MTVMLGVGSWLALVQARVFSRHNEPLAVVAPDSLSRGASFNPASEVAMAQIV
jgi:hypothetical protein